MSEPTKKSVTERIMEAIIKRIEGGDDPRRKYDYLMDPPNIKTSSILTDVQLDSTAECCFLGEQFASLLPLKEFVVELANWSPSKKGTGREQLTATMISTETHVVPMAMQAMTSEKNKKDKKQKEENKDGN